MSKQKTKKVLEELKGKSKKEQIDIIKNHIKNKDYKNSQFKTITNAFKDNDGVLKTIILSLKTLKESAEFTIDKHEKTFKDACRLAEKIIDNPNSTEQERLNAIKLINNCYYMLTAVNGIIIIAIAFVILGIIKLLEALIKTNNNKTTNKS